MNGEHKDEISPDNALKQTLERLITNVDNWAITTKVLIVFHRGLQNIKVNRKIYKELKHNEIKLLPYTPKKDTNNISSLTYAKITDKYANYIKLYLNVNCKTEILSKGMQKINDDVSKLKSAQLLKHYEYFEELMARILDQFNEATYCRQTRLFSNVIFMLFKDLIKVYKVYYVHIMEILERFASLEPSDMQKAFLMYQAFVKLTSELKSKAAKLIYQFNFPI